jgi:S-adenosylmethionine decarboxylase proenzyme
MHSSTTSQGTAAVHPASGAHLLLTLAGCNTELLNDHEKMQELANRAATATGATVLQCVAQQFQPQGVTVVVVLAESHASLHTYPEEGVVFWDCFTCGERCVPDLSIPILVEALQATQIRQQTVHRS